MSAAAAVQVAPVVGTLDVDEADERQFFRDAATRIREERVEQQRKDEEEERRLREQCGEIKRREFVLGLKNTFGIVVAPERVQVTVHDRWSADAEVTFGGVVFSYGHGNLHSRGSSTGFIVKRECAKGCGKPLWRLVGSIAQLIDVLELTSAAHQWPCRVQYDADGNEITDDEGAPLPKPEPLTPEQRKLAEPYDPMKAHRENVERYTAAVKRRRDLEARRHIEKRDAAKRLLGTPNELTGKPYSGTAALDDAANDPQYAAYLAECTDAVIEEIAAREAMILTRPAHLTNEYDVGE